MDAPQPQPMLSIIIPVFDGESFIAQTLEGIAAGCKRKGRDYEIIAVDDCSTDQTARILEDCRKTLPALRVLTNARNRGKGYSVRVGCLAARGRIIGFLDADNCIPAEELESFITALEQDRCDLAIASRREEGSRILRRQSRGREALGTAGNFLIRLLFRLDLRDTQCGCKFFSRRLVQDLFPVLTVDGWIFDVEILVQAQRRGYRTLVLPVTWKDSGESSVRIRSYLQALHDLLALRIKLGQGR
jgi:dolichyl-phosphate beta-glucosyltransferase